MAGWSKKVSKKAHTTNGATDRPNRPHHEILYYFFLLDLTPQLLFPIYFPLTETLSFSLFHLLWFHNPHHVDYFLFKDFFISKLCIRK